MRIAIVTDSTADIPPELARQHNIHIVSNVIVIDGQSLEDGAGISREDFYRRLPKMTTPPTTATASSGSYQRLYERLLGEGFDFIFSIHPPTTLSGIYNAASAAAMSFGQAVRIVDSGQVSLGLGFQVLEAARAVEGGASIEQVQAVIDSVRRRIRLVALLDTLEYVRRSGRVSWAKARLGDLLRIKPFVTLEDGVVRSLGEARTRRKGIARLVEYIQKCRPFAWLAILHTNAEQDARHIIAQINPNPTHGLLLVNVTTVIGTHVGPNGLGFVAVTET